MKAVLWSQHHCPFCDQTRGMLRQKGIEVEERKIGDGYTEEELLEAVPGARTVPQIFIDDVHVGGFPELRNYLSGLGLKNVN